MFISKKSLCALTIGLLGAVTISVTAINSHNISSFAGGITNTSEKGRTLTLDKDTPLTIDGTVGTLDIGNFRVYAPNCESLENGFVTLKDRCRLIIYCPVAEKTDAGYYRGFASSTVSSVEIVSNNRNKATTTKLQWARINEELTIDYYADIYNSFNNDKSEDSQTAIINTSHAFVANQNTPKAASNKYSCFYMISKSSGETIDLYSLTISFTCN